TMFAAGHVFLNLGGPIVLDQVNLGAIAEPLSGAVTTYFLVNTVLVSTAIALTSREHVLTVWRENFLWTAPSYFTGALIVAIAASLGHSAWLLPLAAAPICLIYYTYKVYVARHTEQQHHVKELSELHQAMTESLARAIDAKDQACQGHIRRVQIYAT